MEKTKKMQCFNDGTCTAYALDESRKPILKYQNLRFSERVIGFKRYFSAAQVQVEISRLIRVPSGPNISPHDFIVISQGTAMCQYQIEQVQPIPDSMPPSIDISLRQVEQLLQLET